MDSIEFAILLTQHRSLGYIFQPSLIQKKEKFFSVIELLREADLNNGEYRFSKTEMHLVKIIEKYSDAKLMKKYSRNTKVTDFYAEMEPGYMDKHILPYLWKCLFDVVEILMSSEVKLFYREPKYSNIYDEDEIRVMPDYAKPVFFFEKTENLTRYKLKIFLEDKEFLLLNRSIKIIAVDPCIIYYRNTLISFEKLDAKKLKPFLTKEYLTIPRSIEDKYYSGFIRKAVRDYEVHAGGFEIVEKVMKRSAVINLEKNLRYEPCLVLRFYYDNEQFLPNSGKKIVVKYSKVNGEYQFNKTSRDSEWETTVLKKLREFGLKEKDGYYSLPGMEIIESREALYFLVNWLNENRLKLEENNIITGAGNLEKNYFTGSQFLEIKTKSAEDWFDVYCTVTFGSFSFPFIKLKHHILNDIREFELPDGEIAIIPKEWFSKYKSLLPFAKSKGEKLQFANHHYSLISSLLQPDSKSVLNRLRQLSGSIGNVKLPDELNAQLRNYQKEGFRWMFGLNKNGFGGCLADDMGLGKTLQTITLLLKVRRRGRPLKMNNPQLDLFQQLDSGPDDQPASLIVVPTSLVHNWEAEITRFAGSLKVYLHTGQLRKKNSELEEAVISYDVILTTYGTVRNDIEMLSSLNFHYLILDESQYVKNPASKTYKAVMKLKGTHRLVLTGTPIENSLSDLWAQMNFLNKGMLGNQPFFRRFFITPIEKHNDSDQQEKLRLLIRPFILRRTKEEVARDLPPLMEQVVTCEMSEKQFTTYETEKSVIRNSILADIEREGVKNSAIIILKGLSRLRQLANHPEMMEDFPGIRSGKYEEIFRMLESVVAENHKVLVFSSFVKHLELIRKGIQKEKWKYSILTGITTNRGDVIKVFQDDPDNRIFLISLKAGGVGLNLTSADYVFIIDPWWNPAAEMQAISRAHRIGQDKHVFVYRFITRNSIEEKIQQLQDRKSSLADKFINSNNPLQEITKEEILNLFK